MKRDKRLWLAGLGALVASSLMPLSAQQVTDPSSVFYVRTVTCAEVSGGGAESSGYAYVFLYGYASGEANNDDQSPQEIERIVTEAAQQCEQTPTKPALDVFRELIGKVDQ